MRIIYVYRGIPALSSAVHISGLMQALQALGHDVEPCFALPQSKPAEPPSSLAAQTLQRLRRHTPASVWNLIRLWSDRRTARQLRQRVDARRPDAIYERYVCLSGECARVARELAIPHVLEVNETARLAAENWSRSERERAYRMEDEVFARTAAVIAITGVLRAHLISLGVPPEQISVMHNAVRGEDFSDPTKGRNRTRQRYGLEGRFVIGYMQGWQTISGLQGELMEALKRCARGVLAAMPSAVLVVIGGGAAWQRVRDQLRAYVGERAADRLRFTGPVPHEAMPATLAGLDVGIVLHHSRYHFTSPLKLYEYMAAGTVCVASDLPNHKEMIEHGVTGMLYPAGDIEALAAVLKNLSSDRAALRRLADTGRQHVLAEHTWEANARRVVQIAQELLDARRT